MSGICGIVALGGRDPTEDQIAALTRAMARRGPDRLDHWHKGRAALGHALLATTPEAAIERLPMTVEDCTITADARLDNREALIAALDLSAVLSSIGDGELILRAYREWGEECPNHLLGDFAFAIWDAGAQKLFCARDHFGVRQFAYYHSPGRRFTFATDTDVVIENEPVSHRLNQSRIADYLDGLEEADLTSTFFENVFRLPPAHTLVVDKDGRVEVRRYWRLELGRELRLHSDQAYAEAFRDLFEQAVRCRLRSHGPVGSMLSGGVDSGAVVAVAARLLRQSGRDPLPTFSVIDGGSGDCPETAAIKASASTPGLAPHVIDLAKIDEQADALIDLAATCADPFDGHHNIIRAIYRVAQQRGVRVVLDGVFADSILTAGDRPAQLLRNGLVCRAWAEARAEERFWRSTTSSQRVFAAAAWAAVVPARVRALRRMLMAWRDDRRALGGKAPMSAKFARAAKLVERRQSFRSSLPKAPSWNRDYRVEAVRSPNLTAAAERYDRTAAPFKIEPRHPFLDIRLVEFCLSLPPAQLQRGGFPKLVLRHALAGLVPDDVRWRRGKEHLGWQMTLKLIDRWQDWMGEVRRAIAGLADYVGVDARDADVMDISRQYELVVLTKWISRNRRFNRHSPTDGDDHVQVDPASRTSALRRPAP